MVKYFAYGGNMFLPQMRLRLGWAISQPETIGYLPDSQLIFPIHSDRQRGGVASFTKKTGSKVWGVVYELSDSDIKLLDEWEGFNQEGKQDRYKRRKMIAIDPNGGEISVDVYGAVKEGSVLPSKYYVGKLIAGASEAKLPKDYIKWLSEIKTSD